MSSTCVILMYPVCFPRYLCAVLHVLDNAQHVHHPAVPRDPRRTYLPLWQPFIKQHCCQEVCIFISLTEEGERIMQGSQRDENTTKP